MKTTSNNQNDIPTFIQNDSFCRDVVNRLPLKQFLAETKSATYKVDESNPDINFLVYEEFVFKYEFLDDKLFCIRYLLPRTNASAAKTVAPYVDAFGSPEDIPIPDDFKAMGASKFLYWELPQHHLRVILAYLPDQIDPTVINVYGQFIQPDIASEFLLRSDPMGGLAPKPPLKQQQADLSSGVRQIENLMADPVWGRVASKINQLCSGNLSQNEIHHHILKTRSLAKMGNFSPGFTLQLLESAEVEASRQQLSPVFAVTTCERSLAFSGAANGQSILK